MPAKANEVLIGYVGVDSGQIVLTDPCYLESEWEHEEFDYKEKVIFPDGKDETIIRCSKRWWELIDDINNGKIKLEEIEEKPKCNFSYNAVSKKTLNGKGYGQINFKHGNPGLAVAFRSGIGDGLYPVYARIEELPHLGKRIMEVRIDMADHPLLKPQKKKKN